MKDKHRESEEELRDAPFLGELKKPQFSVPEGYLERQRRSLMNRIEDEAIFEEAPILASLDRKPHFPVPAGYFEAFPGGLQAKISESDREGRILPLRSKSLAPAWSLAIAASLVLLIAFFRLQMPTPSYQPGLDPGLSSEQLLAAIDYQDYDLDMIADHWEGPLSSANDFPGLEDKDDWESLLSDYDLSDIEEALY